MTESYPAEYDSSDMEQAFKDFFYTYTDEKGEPTYQQTINRIGYKGTEPITVNLSHIYLQNPELATYIIEKPLKAIPELSLAAAQNKIHIRKLPIITPIRKIDSAHIDKLLSIQGIVVRSSKEASKIDKAVFECTACGELTDVKQRNQYLQIPTDRCSCETGKKHWELNYHETTFIDHQVIEVQESPDQLPPGVIPTNLEVVLEKELVRTAKPGDKVNITGIIYVRMSKQGSMKLELTRYVIANHVEVINRDIDILNLSQEDIQELEELAEAPQIKKRIIESIAPSCYGHENIKEAISLLLFGSDAVKKQDVRIRGDINIFLCGDPGTWKSNFLQRATELSTRGVMTTGRGSTAAGLTYAVMKDKNTGGFVLEAGALVIADTGLCAIDEMDKMRKEDRAAIHPAMSQQKVYVAKGGIHAILNARCSVLAAANPKLGRYNPYQSISENIDLPVTLLNRFDLIFVLRDIPNQEKDKSTADHILDISTEPINIQPLSTEQLKKYISYAKQVKPTISTEVLEHVRDYYVKLRNTSLQKGESSAIAITARQLESIIRLIKANARLHLRKEATLTDAEQGILIFNESMKQVGIDPDTGELDIDLLETGIPRSLRDKLWGIVEVVGKMQKSSVSGSVGGDVLREYLREKWRMKDIDINKLLATAARDTLIYSPTPEFFKLV